MAYGLAMAETLLGEAEFLGQAGAPQALVVAPTRELALQVQRELTWLYGDARARILASVGGMDPRRERRALEDGVHILVGTPGRLRDHMERGALDLSALQVAVLDEADEMLDLGFREDLEFILSGAPVEKRTLLFSATLPKPIIGLAKRYQRDAMRIEVAATAGGHADIEYRAVRIGPKDTEHAVVNLLRYFESPASIVFCNTRESVRHMLSTLQERGFAAVGLSARWGRTSATRRSRRCGTDGRGSASPPMWPHAASTCRASASSSMPTCRTIPKCSSIAPAAPAARAARARACCWCRRLAAARPRLSFPSPR